jgi:GTP-binding protein YchF
MFALMSGRELRGPIPEGESIEGVAGIRDPRVDVIATIARPEKIKYAEIRFVLCPDIVISSKKKDWLEVARRCDLLCLVVRTFSSAEVYHPDSTVDGERDRRNLEAELVFTDLELVEKRLERMGKEKRAGFTNQQVLEEATLNKCKQALENGLHVSGIKLEQHEFASIKSLGLLTLLPILWAYNVDDSDLTSAKYTGHGEFKVSCRIEQEIMAIADPKDRLEFLRGIGLETSGLERLNQAAYDTMGLMSFYTMGPDEVRAWTIRKGTLAPAAGGKIHSDIERGFIRVEIIKYDDLVLAGSEEAVKKQGKSQVKGKDYIIEDGDICNFRFNV